MRTNLRLPFFLLAVGSTALAQSAAPATMAPAGGNGPRGSATLLNTGLPAHEMKQLGHLTLFNVPESGVDRNADGDGLDEVTHVFDRRTGSTKNFGLAVRSTGGLQVAGDSALLHVPEFVNGFQDLNGDGDINDTLSFLFDWRTQQLLDLGWPVGGILSPDGSIAAALVPEMSQGFTDLNGDGDTSDSVLFVHDVDRGLTTSTGRASSAIAGFGPGLVGFYVHERGQNVDANGDGDLDDQVLHFFDVRFRQVIQTRLAFGPAGARIDGQRAVFFVLESQQGRDLNGDGDLSDHVLHSLERSTFAARNLGLAGAPWPLVNLELRGHKAYVGVSEGSQGFTDLNGEGDFFDWVLHEVDLVTGAARSLGTPQQIVVIRQQSLLLHLNESLERTDFNGDGDAVDQVPGLLDLVSGTLTPLKPSFLQPEPFVAVSPFGDVAWPGNELETGDRNGDGDALDRVYHVLPRDATTPVSLGIAGAFPDLPAFFGNKLHFLADEAAQGGADLSGDGDAGDTVIQVHDVRAGTTLNTQRAALGHSLFGQSLAMGLAESFVGQDLNGDGDQFDVIAHVELIP